MVLLHLRIGLRPYAVPNFKELKEPRRLLTRFKGEHLGPVRTSPGFPDDWLWKHQVHPDNPTAIAWTRGGRVHRNRVLQKVTPAINRDNYSWQFLEERHWRRGKNSQSLLKMPRFLLSEPSAAWGALVLLDLLLPPPPPAPSALLVPPVIPAIAN